MALIMRLLISVFLLGFCLFQAKTQIIKEIRISKAVDPIILDGLLNEVSWQNADVGGDYYQNFPTDTVMATAKTELRFTYDDKFIYVAGKMYNTGTANYVTPSLRRDFRGQVTTCSPLLLIPLVTERMLFNLV